VLVARRQDKLDQLATELSQAYGTRSTVIAADLTDPKAPLLIHE
jgi:short-subunit dehydrogenase